MKIKSILLALSLLPMPLLADPFFTDDAETTPYQEWEFELNSTLIYAKDEPDEKGVNLEIKYGLLSNLEAFLEFGYEHNSHFSGDENEFTPSIHGIGDTEVGLKYKFFEDKTYKVKAVIEPTLGIPTGDNDVSNNRMWFELPLWLEKDWGAISTSGGGGVVFNDADEARNYLFAGLRICTDITDNLNSGLEVFYQGADSVDNSDITLLNLGSTYKLNDVFNLELGLGHSIRGENQTIIYFGIST